MEPIGISIREFISQFRYRVYRVTPMNEKELLYVYNNRSLAFQDANRLAIENSGSYCQYQVWDNHEGEVIYARKAR